MIKRFDNMLWSFSDGGNSRCIKFYDTTQEAIDAENHIKKYWGKTKTEIVGLAYFLESDSKNKKGEFDNFTIIVKKNKDVYIFADRQFIDKWNLKWELQNI